MKRAGVVQTIADLIGFAKTLSTAVGASKSVQVYIQAHENDAGKDPCELWGHAPLLYHQPASTENLYLELGNERLVIATKDRTHQIEVASGEVVIRALGSANAAYVKLKPDGTAEVHASTIKLGAAAAQFVALANLVKSAFTALGTSLTAVATTLTGSADPGAAAATAIANAVVAWASAANVAATKAKAE